MLQAARWAKNKLLEHNRETEIVNMENTFNPGFTAMVKIGIEGSTDAYGDWLISEVEHDLVDFKSQVKLYRVIDTIE